MYKQISKNKFNKLLDSYEQGGTYQKKKSKMTYDMWLQNYKGRTVKDIDVNEHTKWSREFQAWRVGNIEKV
jgi:hypothetical protein|tara:strand:+ start:34 stop:246 length:213 start_codon:yes stop_codon:yes gene_type:complete